MKEKKYTGNQSEANYGHTYRIHYPAVISITSVMVFLCMPSFIGGFVGGSSGYGVSNKTKAIAIQRTHPDRLTERSALCQKNLH